LEACSRRTLNLRRCLVLAVISVTAPLGDSFLDRGVRHLPPMSVSDPLSIVAAVLNPWVLGGIALLICWFASQLTALSWADLSFVLPATSMGNVVVALIAHFWLGEHISAWRWIGILLITMAGGFVARGPSYTETGEQRA
jgi:drug/metabolite transporter (DMT)-like permease